MKLGREEVADLSPTGWVRAADRLQRPYLQLQLLVRVFSEEKTVHSLYEEPWFTFRFGDDRVIPRFHLEGLRTGSVVDVYAIEPGSGERIRLLTSAVVGDEGWVELATPLYVRAGEAFIAEPRTEAVGKN